MEVALSADCAPPVLQVCVLGTSLLTSWDVALQPVKGMVMPGYYHVFLALFTVLRMLPELLWMSWGQLTGCVSHVCRCVHVGDASWQAAEGTQRSGA